MQYFMVGTMGALTAAGAKNTVQGKSGTRMGRKRGRGIERENMKATKTWNKDWLEGKSWR